MRHTVGGYLIHHVMASGWAILHEKFFGPAKTALAVVYAAFAVGLALARYRR